MAIDIIARGMAANASKNASSSTGKGILGTISYNDSAPTPCANGYYIFKNAGMFTLLNKTVKAGDILTVLYNSSGGTYTYDTVIDTDRVDMGTLYFINGSKTGTTIEDGSDAFPFKTMANAVAAMTDLTKSYVLIMIPNSYTDSADITIPAVLSLDIFGNGSTWTIPNVTVACHANVYDLNTIANVNYTYNGTDRSVRDNGKIVGNMLINGGFPHIQNLNFTGIMTVSGGTPYIKDITGGGRIIVNGSSAVLIMSNPNMNMPTVDAANVTVLNGQMLCHGGLLVNKGTTYPNIVLSNTNTPTTFHSFSDLACNIGINAGTTAYTVISPSVLAPILVGSLITYLPSDNRSIFGISSGTAQAQTITIPSAGSSYYPGMEICSIAALSNTGTGMTINVNSWGVKTVKRGDYMLDDTLLAGDVSAGTMHIYKYDGTVLRLQNPRTQPEATQSVHGLMSSTDKTKLDGLSAPLKNNMTGTTSPTSTDDSNKGYLEGSLWIYSGTTYTCTKSSVGSAVWVSSIDIFYFDTWATLIAAISATGSTYVSKYCTVANANGGPSSGAVYTSSSGSVTNPISDGGQATYLVTQQGTVYSITCQTRTITNPIVTSVMLSAANKPTVTGYYIFTVVPTNGLPSGVSLNDIAYYNGSAWSVWQKYSMANTVLVAGSSTSTQVTWRKFQGTWMSTADEYNPDGLEYQTGKLYNNKPVYRKCATGTMTTTSTQNANAGFSVPVTGTILSIAGVCLRTDNKTITITGIGEAEILVDNTNGNVVTWTSASLYLGRPFTAWVEYTKS
jgi:hypothetical protein